ncbi:MAG: type III-A CRISPR-associated protein Cas10/Csm1 [Candidatus Methanofastidiosia archaeon]
MKELNELQIASLLHDIGKFWWRKGINVGEEDIDEWWDGERIKHQILTEKFIDSLEFPNEIRKELVKTLAVRHHDSDATPDIFKVSTILDKRTRELARIICVADNISSGEREKELSKKTKRPLHSIFVDIILNEKRKAKTYYYQPETLTMKLEPRILDGDWKKEELYKNYEKLWESFYEEMKSLPLDSLYSYFNTLLNLLKKYTQLIPSAGFKTKPNISLFDHLKTTCAIATCLYKYWKEYRTSVQSSKTEYFLIISGDISGIQKFIYSVASPQEAQPGMAKRLRGRSFYLNILNESLAMLILRELKLPETNLLWCTGGHFLIIAPNTEKVEKKLKKIKERINMELLRKFRGNIYLTLGFGKFNPEELNKFNKVTEELNLKLTNEKKQKYSGELQKLFQEERDLPVEICIVCGTPFWKDKKERICKECENHEKIGKDIANAAWIIKSELNGKSRKSENDFDLIEFEIGYKFLREEGKLLDSIGEIFEFSKTIKISKLNDTNFYPISKETLSKLGIPVVYGFSFIGNTVPFHRNQREVLNFDHLAQLSNGGNKIGILKMDVDNLGMVFSKGLKNPSISRISTLSSFLELFFSGRINLLWKEMRVDEKREEDYVCEECEKEKGEEIELKLEDEKKLTVYIPKDDVCESCLDNVKIPKTYITYSGGDDLLIVGSWDTTIKLAKKIREEFKEFVCHNPDINISAGIFLSNSKFPIGRSSLRANDLLEKSKTGKKDKISVFGETVKWNTIDSEKGFNELFKFAIELERLVNKDNISKSFVYSLLWMWMNTFGNIKDLNLKVRQEKKKYVPYFKYKLARTVDRKKKRKIFDYLDEKGIKYMPWIKIPVSWVSLRGR